MKDHVYKQLVGEPDEKLLDQNLELKNPHKKRGKGSPKKNGKLNAFILIRRLAAIAIYQKARMANKTDRESKDIAIAEIKKLFPEMKISKTEVERALKELQPNNEMKKSQEVFVCEVNENQKSGKVKLDLVQYKSLRKPNPIKFGNNTKKS